MDVTQQNPNNSPNGRETMPNNNGVEDNPNNWRADNAGSMPNGNRKIDDPFTPSNNDASHNWKTGDKILGRYEVIELLGQGGMGVVYRCLDTVGEVEVAVKALPWEVSHSTAEMDEVRDNYNLVSKLVHTNIAVYKTLEMDSVTGDYYLVMEYVGGEDLRRWMKRVRNDGKIALETALPVLRQIAEALDYAHGQEPGVIHRDVKPENVKILVDGTIKVLDFGLAAQIRTSQAHVSKENVASAGTPLYKSPEQWGAKSRQGPSTDQYSLAVIAYEMLSGHVPFESDDKDLLKAAVLKDMPDMIDGFPKYANTALQTGLAKEATGRYVSCVDFVCALEGMKVKCLKKMDKRICWPIAIAIIIVLWVAISGITYYTIHKKALQKEDIARKAAEVELSRQKAEQARREREAEQARLKAEQERREREAEQARLKAEQEWKEREAEQARKKAEQEATARKAAEAELARLKAEKEAAAKKAVEVEIARLKAEQEAAARKAAEEELARLKAEQEAVVRRAAEAELARQKAELERKKREAEQARKIWKPGELSADGKRKASDREGIWLYKYICEECDGKGQVRKSRKCVSCDGSGKIETLKKCDNCDGTGKKKNTQDCTICDGTGKIEEDCPDCGIINDGRGNILSYHGLVCDNCQGKGRLTREVRQFGYLNYEHFVCAKCGGRGWVNHAACYPTGKIKRTCWSCDGTGTKETTRNCYICDGTGRIKDEKKCADCDYGKRWYFSECMTCKGEKYVWR